MIMVNERHLLLIFLGRLCFLNYIFNSTEVPREVQRVTTPKSVDMSEKNI